MKKEILKYLIITLLFAAILLLIIKIKDKYVYVENDSQHICQKCIIRDGNYYCQVYGGDK